MDSMLNYFECEIVSNGDTGFGIWIGIGPWSDLEDPDPQIHVRKHGVYYEANTGRICISDVYRGQGSERGRFEIGSTCTTGDRIGCGIEFDGDRQSSDSIHVFFTKNGKQLGDSIRCMMPPFSMCPMVGMGEKGQRVHFVQHCYRPSLLRVS